MGDKAIPSIPLYTLSRAVAYEVRVLLTLSQPSPNCIAACPRMSLFPLALCQQGCPTQSFQARGNRRILRRGSLSPCVPPPPLRMQPRIAIRSLPSRDRLISFNLALLLKSGAFVTECCYMGLLLRSVVIWACCYEVLLYGPVVAKCCYMGLLLRSVVIWACCCGVLLYGPVVTECCLRCIILEINLLKKSLFGPTKPIFCATVQVKWILASTLEAV